MKTRLGLVLAAASLIGGGTLMAVQAGAQNGPPPGDRPADARPASPDESGPRDGMGRRDGTGPREGRGGRENMGQRGDRAERGDRREDRRQRPQFSAEDRAAFFDARLAGLRAGLRLNPDQDKMWPPIESAVRDLVKTMGDLREKARAAAPATPASPFERMKAAGEASSARGAALTRMADAAQPLWATLSEEQKRRFRMLSAGVMGAGREGMMQQGRDRDHHHDSDRGRDRDDRRDGDRGRMMRRGDLQSPSAPAPREGQRRTDGQEVRPFRLGSMGPVDRVYP